MKKKGDILIIDDNEAMLVSLRMLLKNVFEDVQTSATPNAIPSLLRKKKPDVVLLDMNFGRGINNGNEGLFWLKEIKRLEPEVAVVLFTAYADIDLAVKGIKEGAADFVVKPFENVVLVEKLTALRRKEAGRLPRGLPSCVIGGSRRRWRNCTLWQRKWPSPMPTYSSPAKTAQARRCWHERFTDCQDARDVRW